MKLLRFFAIMFLMATSFSVYADVCGDGNVEALEQCDDNNVQSGDGCTDICTVESNWNCAGSPSVCEFTSPCTAGNYWNGTACTEATAGHYVPADAATEQKACAMGTYQPNTGTTSCIPADVNYYVGEPAAIAQTACPPNRYTLGLTGASLCAWATYSSPQTFYPNQPALASEVNDNFNSLEDKINQLQAQLDALEAYAGPRTAATLVGVYDIFDVYTDVNNECPTCFSIAGTSGGGTVTFNADGTGIYSGNYIAQRLHFNMQNYSVGFPQPIGDQNNAGSQSVSAATVGLHNNTQVESSPFTWSIDGGVVTIQTEDGSTTAVVAGRMMVFAEDPSEGMHGVSIMVRR